MTPSRRTFLAACAALGASTTLPARAATAPSPADARDDLALLAEAYATLHPGLDRYLGRERWQALIAAEQARAPATRPELFLALARLTAAVRCGHSYPNPVNQSDAVLAEFLDRRDRVPFAFRWRDGRMVVTRALRPGVPLGPGTVIDAIDGIPATELLNRLVPLARADGGNDGKRRALMEVDGNGRFGAFDVYRPLVGPARSDGGVAVEADGRTIELAAMSDAERQSGAVDRAGDGGWRFAITDGIARLTMPNWALYNSKWDWRGFIAEACDRLIQERASGLVIDLRANEGGIDCGGPLLARLIERPLALPAYDRRVRYARVPDALRPHLDTWDKRFFDWGDAARPSQRPGVFELVRDGDSGAAILEPVGPRFSGKVAVLVGPTCSSATFHFAMAIKASGRAVLVGEPTGGNRRGINGGAYFFLRLPRSGLEVDLPLIGYFPRSPQPDAGVLPDIAVAPTRADLAAGRDPALAAALRAVG